MSDSRQQSLDQQVERLQALLATLEGAADPLAKSAARELVQVVLGLHALGLAELLAIVREAGAQPADTLLPRFAANPRLRGLLLLHDLHPQDLQSRAGEAVERLRPHLGVQGVRAELLDVEQGVVRLRVSASGQNAKRPSREALRSEIEATVLELTPDAAGLIIEGLEAIAAVHETYVPLADIGRFRAAGD